MLVDGYNIIHAWDELKIVAQDVLEDARKNLIEILSDYAGFSGQEVIIVFDAHMVKDNVGIIKQYDNVKVVYTKEQETADHFIEKTATDLSKENCKIRVATSDGLEQIMVMGKGAERVSATDLYREVKYAKVKEKDYSLNKEEVNGNSLIDSLEPELRLQLEKMRRKKG